MANTYKTLIITPNRASNTADPKIAFRGGNTSTNTEITLTVYPDSSGTLSIDGSAGQLFSITNDLSNSIFSVNDVSGIPSLEVFANGMVTIAPISGNVGIGNTTPAHKLRVEGATSISGALNALSTLAITGATTLSNTVSMAGAVNATSTLGVTGTLTALGQLVVTTNAAFDTNVLFVDATNNRVGVNNSAPGHAFRVDGATSINGALNALSTLAITGATTLSNTVSMAGAVNATSTLGVSGTLTALGQLVVTTNAAFDTNVLFVDATNNRVGVNNSTPGHAFRVDGTTSINGALNALSTVAVTGALTLSSALTANGGNGTAGQVLTTNGSGVYWSTVSGGSASANTSGGTGGLQFYNGTTFGADANLIFATNTLTVNGAINLGANVVANVTTLFVGNSTANASHTATQLSVANSTNSATLTPISLTIGTTVVNTTAIAGNGISITSLNASNLSVGTVPIARLDANVILTTSTTGINASALSTGTVPDARIAGAYTAVTSLALGANVVANVTTLFVGNSTVNASHTATQFSVANSTNSATLTPISLTIGTTVVNTSTTSLGGTLSVTGNATFDTNTLFVDATNDRVGIGTTGPASKLVVSDAGNYQVGITGTSTTAYTQLYLNGTSRAYGVGVGGGSETAYGVPNDFFIFDHNAAAMRVVIDTSGNVGVGNTSPSHRLRVEGTTSLSGNVAINSTNTTAYNLFVSGSFAATTKSFSIPHPTDDTKTLRYGSLEGPENGVYVRGRARTSTIVLPAYWHALVDEDTITVSVTPNGAPQALWVASVNATHVMIGHDASTSPDYYYHVFAERKDVPRLEVEVSNAG